MFVAVVKDKASAVAAVMSLVDSWRPPLRRPARCCSCLSLRSLAMLHVVVGLINIGLGPGRPRTHPGDVTDLHAAYWLGAMSIVVGIVTFLASGYQCWGIVSAIANLVGACFSIAGIVLYAIDLSGSSFTWRCEDQVLGRDGDGCMFLAYIAQDLLSGMDVTLIVLMSLQLLANITVACVLLIGSPLRGKQENIRGSFQTPQQHVDDAEEALIGRAA